MKILVFVKQVPDDSVAIGVDQEKNIALTDGVAPVVNAFDTYSLELCTRLKESIGDSEIYVASIGDESVNDSLKNCLAVGADEARLIKYDNYKELDATSLAELLALTVKKLEEEVGPFDLISLGRETTDSEAAQVGVILAEKLGLGAMPNIVAVNFEDGKFTAKQETDTGYRTLETSSPCVITVSKPDYDPRYATIKSKMAARRKEIPAIEIEGFEDSSSLKVVSEIAPPTREAGVKIVEDEPEVAVQKAIEIMVSSKAI